MMLSDGTERSDVRGTPTSQATWQEPPVTGDRSLAAGYPVGLHNILTRIASQRV